MSIAVSLATPNTHTLPLDSYQINTYIEYHDPMISNFCLAIILSKKVECRLQTIYSESATGSVMDTPLLHSPRFSPRLWSTQWARPQLCATALRHRAPLFALSYLHLLNMHMYFGVSMHSYTRSSINAWVSIGEYMCIHHSSARACVCAGVHVWLSFCRSIC